MSAPRVGRLPEQPEGMGPNGRPLCRGCGKEVPRGRSTWCSHECVDAAMIRAYPSSARAAVEDRDGGVCARCGADAARTERLLRHVMREPARRLSLWDASNPRRRAPETVAQQEIAREAVRLVLAAWGRQDIGGYAWGAPVWLSLWEADHIKPVVEGGGGCGLENYRTLCRPCHVEVTRELRRRRARPEATS